MAIQIIPENDLEREIVNSNIFKEAISFGYLRDGHSEATVGNHISQILAYIDNQEWDEYRGDLRLLALLHDLGKKDVCFEKGRVMGPGHMKISQEISKRFIPHRPDLLDIIGAHDKYYHFYVRFQKKGKFNAEKFIALHAPLALDLLIRFSYADCNDRESDSVKWFEDKCRELGLWKGPAV